MKTPFHTGRIAIGCMYMHNVTPHHDRDALTLQSALLKRHTHRSDNVWHKLANYIWRML